MKVNWSSKRLHRGADIVMTTEVGVLTTLAVYWGIRGHLWSAVMEGIIAGIIVAIMVFIHWSRRRSELWLEQVNTTFRAALQELNAAEQVEEHFRGINPWDRNV